ncbi:MAG: hypothetical protein EAZ33_10745 [Oscillatoriales cyanobacterium]|nr:MAG: hypothetical protein EAZ33_10745 [Oscillatoriales cyanobacterium]
MVADDAVFMKVFVFRIAASISVDRIAISIALNISLILSLGDSNNNFLYGTILDLLFYTLYLVYHLFDLK